MGLSHQALYIATAGAYANQRKLETVANNLANASTQGYKRNIAVFEGLYEPLSPITPLSPKLYSDLHKGQFSQKMILLDETYIDFSEGTLIETSAPLDIAISGKGFFAVQDEDGNIKYTRAGNFSLSPTGEIITQNGYKLLGVKGKPIRIPFEQWAPEDIVITQNGEVFVGVRHGEKRKSLFIDKIAVHNIPQDITISKKIGENLYEVTDMTYVEDADPDSYKILQGFLESSNVNPITEMMSIIEVQRIYEANLRVISAVDGTISTSIRSIGRI